MFDWSILFNFTGVGPWFYRIFKPLTLKPGSKIILLNNEWKKEEFYIFLTNHTKNPIYDINIVSEFLKEIDTSLLPVDFDSTSIGVLTMGLDFMVCGETENGGRISQTIINNISPGEVKKIKVVIKSREPKDIKFRIKFKVTSFRKEPKSVFGK